MYYHGNHLHPYAYMLILAGWAAFAFFITFAWWLLPIIAALLALSVWQHGVDVAPEREGYESIYYSPKKAARIIAARKASTK